MNKKNVHKKKTGREKMQQLKRKDKASVQEIMRLHGVVRQVKEESAAAVGQITAIFEAFITAVLSGTAQEVDGEVLIHPNLQPTGKKLAYRALPDGGFAFAMVDPEQIQQQPEEE